MHTTTAARSGDLIFFKGAHAKSFDLPFGFSHRDRGIRHDTHDAISIELRVKVESEATPSFKRNRRGFLSRELARELAFLQVDGESMDEEELS